MSVCVSARECVFPKLQATLTVASRCMSSSTACFSGPCAPCRGHDLVASLATNRVWGSGAATDVFAATNDPKTPTLDPLASRAGWCRQAAAATATTTAIPVTIATLSRRHRMVRFNANTSSRSSSASDTGASDADLQAAVPASTSTTSSR